MQDYLRPMVDFVALKFGILIVKRLFTGKCMPPNLVLCLSRINRSTRQEVHFKIFFRQKIQQKINKSGDKSLFLIISG